MSPHTSSTSLARWSGRLRLPCQGLGILAVVVSFVLSALPGAPKGIAVALVFTGLALIALAAAGTFLGPAAPGEPLELASPVDGRWEAINSPTTKVPSHGTHAYGQAYAVDLVSAPEGEQRPAFGTAGAGFLPPDRFPAFGRPVLAPADAVVVRAVGRMRDHRSRSSWLAFAWFFAEGLPRELLGPTGVLGNHVVLRLGDGSHFALAHLQRGSLRVRRGDRVTTGQQVAACGNSGNTTEPHVHCQRQDVAAVFLATGLPWTVRGTGIPANGQVLEAVQREAGVPTEP